MLHDPVPVRPPQAIEGDAVGISGAPVPDHDVPQLLTPAQVARFFCVDRKTVTRWARAGKLSAVLTPGGQRRYLRSDVDALYDAGRRRIRALVDGGDGEAA